MTDHESDPQSMPYAAPPQPHPRSASLRLPDGTRFPLLPVYVGLRPSEDDDPRMLHTWRLFAHPDLPEDITMDVSTADAGGMSVLVDVVPPGAGVLLEMYRDGGKVVVPRHPG